MATIKFLNAAGKYDDAAARDDVIRYITQKVKTPSGYIGACGVDLPYAAQQMQAVAESFKKDNKVRIRHFVVSFYRNEAIDPYKASMIASTIAGEIGRIFQCVYAVHEDTYHLHRKNENTRSRGKNNKTSEHKMMPQRRQPLADLQDRFSKKNDG